MDMKRFFLYAIVIAALALAGCGGNGGGGDMAGNGDPMSCPDGQTGTPPNCVTPTPPTCLENPDAANCTGPTQAQIDADTKAAGTKKTAITAESVQTDDAGLGGSGVTASGNDEGAYNLAIKRDRMATTVTVTVEGATDPADEKFVQAMDLGEGTTMHTRTMDADDDGNVVEEVVIVTTDIEAPKAVEFAKLQVVTVSSDQSTTTTTMPQELDVNPKTTGGSDFQSLNIATSSRAETGINFALIMGPPAAAVEGGSQTTPYEDDAATQDVNERRFMGTYNGAEGTFVCTTSGGTACSATTNNKGTVTALVGDWNFTPATGATSDQPDYDYLSYGFWLKKTTDKDGVLTYDEVETFASSSAQLSGTVASVTGSAKYSGGATGVYVHSVTTPEGTEASATSGHFLADVELTATFGQVNDDDGTGTIAPNLLNTLTGIINSFRLSGHDEGPGWSVVLEGDITPSDGTAFGMAKGGMGDGSFSATFHGDTGTDDTEKPSSVVGEFNSGFSNGSVAGAFGARIKP